MQLPGATGLAWECCSAGASTPPLMPHKSLAGVLTSLRPRTPQSHCGDDTPNPGGLLRESSQLSGTQQGLSGGPGKLSGLWGPLAVTQSVCLSPIIGDTPSCCPWQVWAAHQRGQDALNAHATVLMP